MYRVVRRNGRRVVTVDRAFLLFVCEVGRHFDRLLLVGRTVEGRVPADYELPDGVELCALPYYESLHDPARVARATVGAAVAFWRIAARVDVVWAFGPHPLQLLFVVLARLRGCRVVLGVRQDTVEYFRARARATTRLPLLRLAEMLDRVHRLLARRLPSTAVGEAIAASYAPARVFPMTVTLVRGVDRASAPAVRDSPATVELLTVGRIDAEKNPLGLVRSLALLEPGDPGRFRLTWVGRGPLEGDVLDLARELGVEANLELRGYVPQGDELLNLYRSADVFVHVSLTEGVPQALVEALSYGVPVVATDVGGVRAAVGGGAAALLVPPDDAEALATAVRQVAGDPSLARQLAGRGLELTRRLTLEDESRRVAAFLARRLPHEAVVSPGVEANTNATLIGGS